jgi:hypothetical protein
MNDTSINEIKELHAMKCALLFRIISELLEILPDHNKVPRLAKKFLSIMSNQNIPQHKLKDIITKVFNEEFPEDDD